MSLDTKNTIENRSHELDDYFDNDRTPIVSVANTSSRYERLEQAVEQKYGLFLAGLKKTESQTVFLQQLLVDRERVLNATTTNYFSDDLDSMMVIDKHQEILDQIDEDILALLTDDEYERFDLFSDSGLEQYQLARFEKSLSADTALNTLQAQEVLIAKLRHKRLFLDAVASAQILAQAGDQEAAKWNMELAVKQYQQGYLMDAEQVLTPEQYHRLAEFEAHEFEDIYLSW